MRHRTGYLYNKFIYIKIIFYCLYYLKNVVRITIIILIIMYTIEADYTVSEIINKALYNCTMLHFQDAFAATIQPLVYLNLIPEFSLLFLFLPLNMYI